MNEEQEARENELWGTLREVALVDAITPQLPKKSTSILDVGCGDGYLLHCLSHLNSSKTGVDMNSARLKRAQERVPDVTFIKGDVYKLPFKDKTFDVVICSEVLEHLEHPEKALKELKRVAKQKIIVTVPNDQELVKIICPHCEKEHYLSGHIQRFNRETIKSLGESAGLRFIAAKKFHTIFSYNKLTKKLPRFVRTTVDWGVIHLEPILSFCKANYLLVTLTP